MLFNELDNQSPKNQQTTRTTRHFKLVLRFFWAWGSNSLQLPRNTVLVKFPPVGLKNLLRWATTGTRFHGRDLRGMNEDSCQEGSTNLGIRYPKAPNIFNLGLAHVHMRMSW